MSQLDKPSQPSFRGLLKSILYTLAPPGTKLGLAIQKLIRFFRIRFSRLNRDYRKWVEAFDDDEILAMEKRGNIDNKSSTHLKFSILMPVYNPKPALLDEAIQSVRDQTYSNWELCIADDASSLAGVKEIIQKHQQEDERVLVEFRDENGNISVASNSALVLAAGEYVVLFDHDDLLHPHALEKVAGVISNHPNAEIIYSDRDKITEKGVRYDPYFKPDFDDELLLAQNYISHLDVYKRETVEKVGGFRVGLEGAQDYDLLLRILDIVDRDDIFHIPHVLYHWRASSGSVAFNLFTKQYAVDAGRKALVDHLRRREIKGQVSFNNTTTAYEIAYEQAKQLPEVEVIVLSNTVASLPDLIVELIENSGYPALKVTVGIFGEVGQQVRHSLETYSSVQFIELESDLRNAQNINQLIAASDAEVICVIDERLGGFAPGWLTKLVTQSLREGVGAVGPKLLDPTGKIYSDGMILNAVTISENVFSSQNRYYGGYHNWGLLQRSYTAISEKCVLFQRESFLDAGGLNENLSLEKSAWVDLFLKMKALGLRNIFVPSILLQFTEPPEDDPIEEDRAFFLQNWGNWINNDPAFNPHLKLKNNEIRINLQKK